MFDFLKSRRFWTILVIAIIVIFLAYALINGLVELVIWWQGLDKIAKLLWKICGLLALVMVGIAGIKAAILKFF